MASPSRVHPLAHPPPDSYKRDPSKRDSYKRDPYKRDQLPGETCPSVRFQVRSRPRLYGLLCKRDHVRGETCPSVRFRVRSRSRLHRLGGAAGRAWHETGQTPLGLVTFGALSKPRMRRSSTRKVSTTSPSTSTTGTRSRHRRTSSSGRANRSDSTHETPADSQSADTTETASAHRWQPATVSTSTRGVVAAVTRRAPSWRKRPSRGGRRHGASARRAEGAGGFAARKRPFATLPVRE